jgi:hypothetical protein
VRNRVIASSAESVPPGFCTASHACSQARSRSRANQCRWDRQRWGFSGAVSVTGRFPDAVGLLTGFQRVGYEASTTAAPPRRECARRGLDPIPPPNREDEAMQDTVNQVHGAVPRALADIVGVIGVSSWPTACRTISSIWVAHAAPVETNAS